MVADHDQADRADQDRAYRADQDEADQDQPDQDRAYREYVQRRTPELRRLAYLLSQDWHRADDLVQGALMRLYLHWNKFSVAVDQDAYARTVLIRVFLSEQRGAWARRVVLLDRMPERSAPAGPDLASRLELNAALGGLPPRQRAVLVLRFYCDLSVEQTAATLHCATGTVKSQTAKGLATLRRALGRPEPPVGGGSTADQLTADRTAMRS